MEGRPSELFLRYRKDPTGVASESNESDHKKEGKDYKVDVINMPVVKQLDTSKSKPIKASKQKSNPVGQQRVPNIPGLGLEKSISQVHPFMAEGLQDP